MTYGRLVAFKKAVLLVAFKKAVSNEVSNYIAMLKAIPQR